MQITYKVKGQVFSFDLQDIDERTTPRSIAYQALAHYSKSTGTKVRHTYYDDDNSVYRLPSLEVKVQWSKEFQKLPALKGYSKKEIMEMF